MIKFVILTTSLLSYPYKNTYRNCLKESLLIQRHVSAHDLDIQVELHSSQSMWLDVCQHYITCLIPSNLPPEKTWM